MLGQNSMIGLEKVKALFDFCGNMGWRYVAFRVWYEMQIKAGLLKLRFPVKATKKRFISLGEWQKLPVNFFFKPGDVKVKRDKFLGDLEVNALNIPQNKFQFFSYKCYDVADWHTNPETGFTYEMHKHWSHIPDFSKEAGDIKYVWEKSRFSFLYDLIRYDFHFEKDQSEVVFQLIEDWINANPVNCGPNWKCSQEITLRVLNWLFALHYYQFSENLNQVRFDKMIANIYDQMCHVEENIMFSLIAVRNNHALTESLGLYVVGLLLPFFPESERWTASGKKWFEKEVGYQISEDGTFLQFSMNYHRVAVQLLTWAISLAELNGEQWSDIVYDRAEKSLRFLCACQDIETGRLPNYGNNDGALFFPLTSCEFQDFRPQLAALAKLLDMDTGYGMGNWNEEVHWLVNWKRHKENRSSVSDFKSVAKFSNGGYYVLRDDGTLTFLRCGSHKTRPFQADNLHLDIWVNGENILRDAGSYLYNTDEKWTRYFGGTVSHNTVMLGNFDQMKKWSRFIWLDWIKTAKGIAREENDTLVIEAEFEGFAQLGKGILHKRKVIKSIGKLKWIIEDQIENAPPEIPMHQIWHPSDYFFEHFDIKTWDDEGIEIKPQETPGWYSEHYGSKIPCRRLVFSSPGRFIRAVIRKRE